METAAIFISVVTPSYNQASFISDTIESVRNQSVSGVEHIVVDGGSKDGTLEILKRCPDITWISEPDRGQSDALNKGVARARGEWIVWINSDDCLLPQALEKFISLAAAHPEARFVFSNTKTAEGWRPSVEEGITVTRRYWDRREGTLLLRQAWKANPLALASFTHMRFRLRRRIGPRAYDRLSRVVPGLRGLHDVFVEKEYHEP